MEASYSKHKSKPSKIEDLTKEQIRLAIVRKRECNAKAQTIVENLLERGITECYLLQCLPDINQSHFEDVIEERAIIHVCGYPLCQNPLSQKDIPKQKYRISMKTNKVYDITARKSFCSNSCYKAAVYLKNQMLTSPLWFREYEEMPTFRLLPLDTVGSLGQVVDVSLIDRVKFNSEKPLFSSVNDFASASLNEMSETSKLPDSDNAPPVINREDTRAPGNNAEYSTENLNVAGEVNNVNVSTNDDSQITQPNSNNQEIVKHEHSGLTQPKKYIKLQEKKLNPLNIVGEIVERPEKKIDPILMDGPRNVVNTNKSKNIHKKQPAVTALTIEVETCLAEWFTLDTMLFLFGEDRVKEMVADKGECIKEYLSNYANSIAYNSNSYDQYQALCRKLNMLELEEKKYDSQTQQRDTKPLPNYTILQEESKKMQLKVKAFFSGETEIPETQVSSTSETLTTEDDKLTQLPLVDKNAQNALRRRIVCEHLNRVLPDLLRSLGLLSLTISSDVRLLVSTFKLNANNIMFKPIQWTLIAIIVINLLSLRDKRLAFFMERPTAYQHLQLLLLSYKQDGGYLERLVSWLTDIDRLLDTNDTQLTVE